MPHEPEKVAECRAWLDRAWADLDSATILVGAARPRPDTTLFHCQQAVEKAWKAFLFWHDVPFRKTHNLRELGEGCAGIDASLAPLAQRAEDLTQFAWVFRYPGEPEEPHAKKRRPRSPSPARCTTRCSPACPGRCGREPPRRLRAAAGAVPRHPSGAALLLAQGAALRALGGADAGRCR